MGTLPTLCWVPYPNAFYVNFPCHMRTTAFVHRLSGSCHRVRPTRRSTTWRRLRCTHDATVFLPLTPSVVTYTATVQPSIALRVVGGILPCKRVAPLLQASPNKSNHANTRTQPSTPLFQDEKWQLELRVKELESEVNYALATKKRAEEDARRALEQSVTAQRAAQEVGL
jgi:hypothetical protein